MRERLIEILAEVAATGRAPIDLSGEPAVLLMVGVNGTGKTTTIGKIAWHLSQGVRPLGASSAPADTYRAAAAEQLAEWARAGRAPSWSARQPGGDPGAVAFDAIAAARARGADVVIVDTAGRLHTQGNLMDELAKVRRVIAKQMPDAPHETLISIDATTGQNGLRQAKIFSEAVEVDGVVLTKLDGTAKGGIALAIAGELGIPVKLIGTGEALEDLRPFDPEDFARALLGRVASSWRVFDQLSERLQATLSDVRSRGKLGEDDVDAAMREIRLALLEADVNFKVVKAFTTTLKERCLGADVLESLDPGQQVVKIVNEELTALMGGTGRDLAFASNGPTVILMAGLQGSGKTTACAKLARHLGEAGKTSPSPPATSTGRPRSTSWSPSASAPGRTSTSRAPTPTRSTSPPGRSTGRARRSATC